MTKEVKITILIMKHVGSNEGILYELFLFIGVLSPIFNQHPAVFVMPYTNRNPGPSFVDGFKKSRSEEPLFRQWPFAYL